MQNYRAFPQASAPQRSPLATSARRGQGPMVPPPHVAHAPPQQPAMTAAQVQAQRLDELRRTEAARRISKKPTDREIPPELADVVVGDGVAEYGRLREVERQLDAVMMRKRLDISDNMEKRYARREGVLRVWVSNAAEGQPWQVIEEGSGLIGDDGALEFGESSQATFRVKLEGRLVDDAATDDNVPDDERHARDSAPAAAEPPRPQQRPRFSHFFKAIRVHFLRNPSLQPDGYSEIEWRKAQPGPGYDPNSSDVSFDTLEFERKSDENINIVVNLYREDRHERFRLSPQLAEILDTEEDDRAGAVQGIWEYCRARKLQEDDDRRWIQCDEQLRQLFGRERIYFPSVPDLLHPHLQPLPPIQLNYTIRLDKAYIHGDPDNGVPPSAPTIYDIRVPLPNPLGHQATRSHVSKGHLGALKQAIKIDDDLALLVQKIHQTNAKRKFYENLAKDPTNFVKRWIGSQQRDLEVILAEATRGGGEDVGGEEWKRGGKDGVWGSRLAEESVGLYLAKKH